MRTGPPIRVSGKARPLTEADRRLLLEFNPNHDEHSGEFTSGDGESGELRRVQSGPHNFVLHKNGRVQISSNGRIISDPTPHEVKAAEKALGVSIKHDIHVQDTKAGVTHELRAQATAKTPVLTKGYQKQGNTHTYTDESGNVFKYHGETAPHDMTFEEFKARYLPDKIESSVAKFRYEQAKKQAPKGD